MLWVRLVAILFALLISIDSSGQQVKRPVHFRAGAGPGTVERALYFAIQERLAASSTMYEERAEKSDIVLRVIAYDLDNDDPQRRGTRAAYSVILLTPTGFLLSTTIGKCGSKVVDQCAVDILAMTLQELRQ